jgi:DNA polymerase-3 subunit alpha
MELRTGKNEGAQASLFDGDEQEESKNTKEFLVDNLPEIDDFSQAEKLSLEKELLGLYLTEHPLTQSLISLRDRVTHRLADLGSDSVGKTVKIGGILTTSRVVTTKNSGKQMAFATLEDDTGTVELVIFPQTFEKTRGYWDERLPLIIEAKVEYREDALSLIVNTVSTLAEAPALNNSSLVQNSTFIVKIPRGTKPQALLEINQLLQSHKGDHDLTILIENGFGEKKIKLPYGVAWNRTLEEKIKNILSEPSASN